MMQEVQNIHAAKVHCLFEASDKFRYEVMKYETKLTDLFKEQYPDKPVDEFKVLLFEILIYSGEEKYYFNTITEKWDNTKITL